MSKRENILYLRKRLTYASPFTVSEFGSHTCNLSCNEVFTSCFFLGPTLMNDSETVRIMAMHNLVLLQLCTLGISEIQPKKSYAFLNPVVTQMSKLNHV